MPKRDRSFCIVPQCNSQGSRNPDVSFFRFPRGKFDSNKNLTARGKSELQRRAVWIGILQISKSISNRSVVCSKHFDDSDFFEPGTKGKRRRLRRTAVPSLYLPVSSSNSENTPENMKEMEKRSATANPSVEETPSKSLASDSTRKSNPEIGPSTHQTQVQSEDQEVLNAAKILLSMTLPKGSPSHK